MAHGHRSYELPRWAPGPQQERGPEQERRLLQPRRREAPGRRWLQQVGPQAEPVRLCSSSQQHGAVALRSLGPSPVGWGQLSLQECKPVIRCQMSTIGVTELTGPLPKLPPVTISSRQPAPEGSQACRATGGSRQPSGMDQTSAKRDVPMP